MDNRPVGIFDSGLGGLTVVRVLRRLMPNERIIYFGDTGRMPYGSKSRAQIRQIASQNISFVEEKGVKAILAACGTISSNAPDILSANEIKAIGVLMPGAKELAETGFERLGVIATQCSIESGAFQKELMRLRPDAVVTAAACPDFVPMIESGRYRADDAIVRQTVADSLRPLKEAGVQALLLGCTHYGLIAEAISDYLGGDVALIGAADASARALKAYLEAEDMQAEAGDEQYYTSGSVENFTTFAPLMLGYQLRSGVKYVEPFPLEEEQ